MANQELLMIDELMNAIKHNKIKSGEKLPSENKLAEKYNVPRMTARSALIKLEERGYIYSVQGKGRYVKEKLVQIQLPLTGDTSFTEKMQKMGYPLRTENIVFEKVPYDKKVYQLVQAESEDTVYQIGRLRYINDVPIAIHYSFVKEASFPDIVDEGAEIVSMFSFYRKQGIEKFTSNQTLVSVAFPSLEEQHLLAVKSMVPLLVVETNCVDEASGRVLEYTKILYRSDTFKYDISMNT